MARTDALVDTAQADVVASAEAVSLWEVLTAAAAVHTESARNMAKATVEGEHSATVAASRAVRGEAGRAAVMAAERAVAGQMKVPCNGEDTVMVASHVAEARDVAASAPFQALAGAAEAERSRSESVREQLRHAAACRCRLGMAVDATV
jgi:hypothetical protein